MPTRKSRPPPKPKPTKITSRLAVVCDTAPDLFKPGWKELYDYGIATAALSVRYKDTKDVALGHQVMERSLDEAEKWLQMEPPEYPGAAKKYINMEETMFTMGYTKLAMKPVEDKTDEYIARSNAGWRVQLREACEINREARSFLPCCAGCGKHQPSDGIMCTGCHIAEYCSLPCQQQHWEQLHAKRCGKQRACAACGNLPVKHLKCGRCMDATYCNKTHQLWHWTQAHKKECKKA
jgi:hypothetical protein